MESALRFEMVKGIISDLLQMDVTSRYPYIVEELADINELIEKKAYYIAVVGEFSSGKSTFLNSLMGRDLLPHGVSETTATVTYIHNVPENSDLVNRISIYFSDPSVSPVNDRLDNGSFTLREVLSTNSESYSVATQIDRVDIYVHFLDLDEPIVLIDTPGTNGLAERHREILMQAVQQAHACICLFHLRGLGETDVKFMRSLMNSQTEFFFVLNHIDDLKEGEETREERMAKFKKEILHDLFLDNDVQVRTYGISALKALAARDYSIKRLYSDSTEDILDKDRSLLVEQSGVPEFENDLIQYVKNGAIETGIFNTVLHRVDGCVKTILGDLSIKESLISTNPSIDVLRNALEKIDECYSDFESRKKSRVAAEIVRLRDKTLLLAKNACENKRVALKQYFDNQVKAEETYEGLRRMMDDDHCKEQLEAFWLEITSDLQSYVGKEITIIIEAEALDFSSKINVMDFKRSDSFPGQPTPHFELNGNVSSNERLTRLKQQRDKLRDRITELGDADSMARRLRSISDDIGKNREYEEKLRMSHEAEIRSLGIRPAVEYRQVVVEKERRFLWIFRRSPKKTYETVPDYSRQKVYDETVATLDSNYEGERKILTTVLEQLNEEKVKVQRSIDELTVLEEKRCFLESRIQVMEERYQEERKVHINNVKKRLLNSIYLQIERALGNPDSDEEGLFGTIFADLDHGIRSYEDEMRLYVEEQLSVLYRSIADMAKQRLRDVIDCEIAGEEVNREAMLEKERTQLNETNNRIALLYETELPRKTSCSKSQG